MKSGIILLTIFILLGTPIAKACEDWTDEMEAQFQESITVECKQMTDRGVWNCQLEK